MLHDPLISTSCAPPREVMAGKAPDWDKVRADSDPFEQ